MRVLKHILHVEDDADVRDITRMALSMSGELDVIQYPSGEAALAAIEHHQPDLFLLDYMMPGMTGPELWEHFRAVPHVRETPVVFMTAKAEQNVYDGLIEKGALAVIVKPFDPIRLADQLRDAWNAE